MTKFRPIEVVARSRSEFEALPRHGGIILWDPHYDEKPRRNPPRKPREPEFRGLKVRLVLVHDPDYDASARVQISNAVDVFELMKSLQDEGNETFWVVVLNTKLRVQGVCEVARGQVDQVLVTPADILRPVLAAGANRCIIVHNHPSGEPSPSQDDRSVTDRVAKAAKLLGMELLDHIIIAREGFVSFKDLGML